jgi:hypothetical protein
LFALTTSLADANVGQTYGYGSRTAALAGAGVAYGWEGFAAHSNPAGLSFKGEKRLILDFGIIAMFPSFTPISNVVTENDYVSDKTPPEVGSVDTSYRSVLGTEMGLVYRLLPEAYNLTVGVTAFLPLSSLAYMDSGATYQPEYVLYRSRNQSPQVDLGVGADFGHGFQFGAGLHAAFNLTSNGTVFLQGTASKPSSMRFSASMNPKFAPFFGALYSHQDQESSDAEPKFTIGAVFRMPINYSNLLVLNSGAQVLGSTAGLDFNFNATSSILYDPMSVELGATLLEGQRCRTYLQLDYQAWSNFDAPALNIQNPTTVKTGVVISPSQLPAYKYKNIFIPRVGQEVRFGRGTLRLGYAFQPSMIDNPDGQVAAGAGNYLDPSKNIYTVGYGYEFEHFLSVNMPFTLNAHFAYQALLTQHIAKTPGDEGGNGTGNLKVGAPGYDAGGEIWGGGFSLVTAF